MFEVTDTMRNNRIYNGVDRKFGITYQGNDYIVKFGNGDMSVYTEYIASCLLNAIGIESQTVFLGLYKGYLVDVIYDFASNNNLLLHSYKGTKQSSENTPIDSKLYDYEDIYRLITKHVKIRKEYLNLTLNKFNDMLIGDAIIGNLDRHKGNWGYLVYGLRDYRFAPLYDNGNSLFTGYPISLDDWKYYIFEAPYSCMRVRRKRLTFYELFKDLRWSKQLSQRVSLFRSNLLWQHLLKIIYQIVHSLDINPTYKIFYIKLVVFRYRCIVLREPFKKVYKDLSFYDEEKI